MSDPRDHLFRNISRTRVTARLIADEAGIVAGRDGVEACIAELGLTKRATSASARCGSSIGRERSSGAWYENEYALIARAGAKGIEAVFEMLDTLALLEFMTGARLGDSFRNVGALAEPHPTLKDTA
jgi:hypothetical protein